MIFIYYPKCSTCQKAKKWLEENNIKFVERDIKTNNPNYNEIKAWYQASKLPLKKFFNTSGLLYKELNLKENLKKMNIEEQIKLLSTNGMLLKRPLMIINNKILIGFKEKEYQEYLKNS